MPLTPNERARRQAIADALITVWFLVTLLALLGAWFGIIPTPS